MLHRQHSLRLFSQVVALSLPAVVAHAQPAPAEPPDPAAAPLVEPAPASLETLPPAAEPEKPKKEEKGGKPLKLTYDRGIAFATEDGSFRAKLNLRNQLRFESFRPLEDGAEFSTRLYIPRSRLQIDGNVFGEGNRYKLEFGLGDSGSFSFVRDLIVDKRVAPSVWLRFGQWKRPFNRQELVSDFTSQFNERAITATYVGGGRDLGISLHNDYEKSADGIEWAIGVFNRFNGGSDRPVIQTACELGEDGEIDCNTGAPQNFPGDWNPAVVARVGWNSKNSKGYSEGDLEGGPLRVSVGASYKIDLANLEQGDEESTAKNLSHGAGIDAMLKVEGFSLQVGGFLMKIKSADPTLGGMVQAGYFVLPKKVEIAGRFAIAPQAQNNDERRQIEARGAFNWFWEGHRWKWMTDFGIVQLTGENAAGVSDDPDIQIRSMAQVTF